MIETLLAPHFAQPSSQGRVSGSADHVHGQFSLNVLSTSFLLAYPSNEMQEIPKTIPPFYPPFPTWRPHYFLHPHGRRWQVVPLNSDVFEKARCDGGQRVAEEP